MFVHFSLRSSVVNLIYLKELVLLSSLQIKFKLRKRIYRFHSSYFYPSTLHFNGWVETNLSNIRIFPMDIRIA